MIKLTRSPTKFGGGIGLLWRGMNLTMLSGALVSGFRASATASGDDKHEWFFFESARSALFHALTAIGIGTGDEVIVSAFTCDAVTYAVMRTGATVVYVDINDDLTMNAAAVLTAMSSKTKALVVQNTLGRLGLHAETIKEIRASGILVVEDCALSIGSRVGGVSHGNFGDISTWSLEASKTLTIGWGGVLTVNNSNHLEIIRHHYLGLKRVPLWLDLRRLLQLWISVLMTAHPPPLGVLLWYFFYGFGLFRRSSDSQRNYYIKHGKLGLLSQSLLHSIAKKSVDLFRQTHENYMLLAAKAQQIGLCSICIPDEGEYIVSPRFSFIVKEDERELLTKSASLAKIELGRWFDQAPPEYGLNKARISSSANAHRISRLIVNLPCHWSLSPDDLQSMVNWMETISLAPIKAHRDDAQ